MVSDSPTPARSARDRAQLILIAAIALAFIILGIVVVFNSVLYTQTMSSSSSIETTSDAQQAELEMARGVRGIAHDVNLNSSHDALDDVNGTLESNSSPLVGQYQNATAERRPAIVDLSVVGASEPARATNSSVPNIITESLVFDASNRSSGEIGHFVVKLDSTEFGENDELIVSANESVTVTEITIESDNDDLKIDHPDGNCSVEPTEDIVVFDFTTGTITGGDSGTTECSIRLIDPDESYTWIRLEGDAEGDNYYELVARGDAELTWVSIFEDGHPAAWTTLLEYTYDTSELSVDRQFEVDVYGDRR